MSNSEQMFSLKTVKAMIKQFTGVDQVIGVPRPFIRMTGDHVSAMVLNQILYLSDSFDSEDGWFYRSREQWEQDICVTPYQLDRAVKHLAQFGVEKAVRKFRGAPTLHFRVDWQKFLSLFTKFLENQETKQSSPINKKLDNQETSLSDTTQNPHSDWKVKKLDNQKTEQSIVEKLDHPLKDKKIHLEESEEKEKGERARGPDIHPAVAIFQEIYGEPPAPFNQDLIEQGVANLAVWRETLKTRRGNGTPITKVGTMLKCYNADLLESERNGSNGSTQANRSQTGRGNKQPIPADGKGQSPGQPYDPWRESKRL